MSDILQRLGRAFKSGAGGVKRGMGPGRYSAGDRAVACPHCGGETFAEGRAQLNTAGLTLLDLDWANRSATTLICTSCGHVSWFLKSPVRISASE